MRGPVPQARQSEGTFYSGKAKFGGMTVSEAKRLKTFEDESAKLTKLLAEQMLDLAAMQLHWIGIDTIAAKTVVFVQATLSLARSVA